MWEQLTAHAVYLLVEYQLLNTLFNNLVLIGCVPCTCNTFHSIFCNKIGLIEEPFSGYLFNVFHNHTIFLKYYNKVLHLNLLNCAVRIYNNFKIKKYLNKKFEIF